MTLRLDISIHAPTRGATEQNYYTRNETIFQSTLPRGERRALDKRADENRRISIHAPTRGATVLEVAKYPVKPISIHAPTRGATTPRVRVQKIRPHISIHAPTRGATMIRRRRASDGEFQSTLPRGERRSATWSTPDTAGFQSTLPRGERLGGIDYHIPVHVISIHAPTRGATAAGTFFVVSVRFQSTLPRGERRRCRQKCRRNVAISIHAPTRGATRFKLLKCLLRSHFNPRSHEGSD